MELLKAIREANMTLCLVKTQCIEGGDFIPSGNVERESYCLVMGGAGRDVAAVIHISTLHAGWINQCDKQHASILLRLKRTAPSDLDFPTSEAGMREKEDNSNGSKVLTECGVTSIRRLTRLYRFADRTQCTTD